MENGFYRTSDVRYSMQDWIALNFTEIPQEAVIRLCDDEGEDECLLALRGDEPIEPDAKDSDAHAEWEEAHAEWEDIDLPMWGAMWLVENTQGVADALRATGFKVFEVTGGLLEDFSSHRLLLFGVDGAGYSFHGAHWIPLRAALCRKHLAKGYVEAEDYRKVIDELSDLISREGEEVKIFRKEFLPGLDTEEGNLVPNGE